MTPNAGWVGHPAAPSHTPCPPPLLAQPFVVGSDPGMEPRYLVHRGTDVCSSRSASWWLLEQQSTPPGQARRRIAPAPRHFGDRPFNPVAGFFDEEETRRIGGLLRTATWAGVQAFPEMVDDGR